MPRLKSLSPQLKGVQFGYSVQFFLHARYVSGHEIKFPGSLSNQTAMVGSWHTQENAHPSAGHVTYHSRIVASNNAQTAQVPLGH